jgi:hypothetical protein
MTTTIWKYPIPLYRAGMVSASPVLDMPAGAEILTLQVQDEKPTLWARVDPEQPPVRRQFAIVGTGHQVPDNASEYIGTWQSALFVFHLFEIT